MQSLSRRAHVFVARGVATWAHSTAANYAKKARAIAMIVVAVLCVLPSSEALASGMTQAEVDAIMQVAQDSIDSADDANERLLNSMEDLRSAYAEYLDACDGVRSVSEKRIETSNRIAELDVADAAAKRAAALAREELAAANEEDWLLLVLNGEASFAQADEYKNMLEKLASYEGEDARAAAERRGLEALDTKLREEFESERALVQEHIDACNEAAAAIERSCSDMRRGDSAAGEAVDSIDDSVAGIAETRAQLAEIQSVHRRNRSAGSALVGEWYDVLDSLSGSAEGKRALTFGAGAEFALSEDEFVAKWGSAIDAYYDEYSAGVGRDVPLCGYGETMAHAAWKWHVDPRLCAAVSVTESSGGLYCIRPHNAWGWGAADSDPYNLAWEWASWEEAIEAWHEGVATSTTGLADAESVEEFGSIYASSPAWPGNTATYMQEVGEHAR